MKHSPADLRLKLFITIRGEEALDYGGVAKLVIIMKLNDSNGSNCDCNKSYGQKIYANEDVYLIIFTARCTLVQSAVLRSYIVRLSVCPSVCNV